MSEKRLAYIVTVKEMRPIKDKDRIVLAAFNETSWRCIVAKDDFVVGDRALYIETNSILPEVPEFEFLRKRCYSPKRKGFVIKTMKMGEAYSEGLCIPLRTFPPEHPVQTASTTDDLTDLFHILAKEDEIFSDILGTPRAPRNWFVRKWNWILFKLGVKGFRSTTQYPFPKDLTWKTDETQVQSLTYVFETWQGKPIDVTQKMDGQSATYIFDGTHLWICSRNLTLYKNKLKKAIRDLAKDKIARSHPHLYCAQKYKIAGVLEQIYNDYQKPIAIQGEVCGPKIQSNRIGLTDYVLYVFNVLVSKRCMNYNVMSNALTPHGMDLVPYLETSIFRFENIEQLEQYAKGFYPNRYPQEGVVIRQKPLNSSFYEEAEEGMSHIKSFKVINPEFKIRIQKEEE